MTQKRDQSAPEPGQIRVGLIGASLNRGWAAMAHIPAIRAVPGLTLHAVATRGAQSARAAAEAFDAPLWFDDAEAMIAHQAIDAVIVAVKAPAHFSLVKQALLAGKPVYCEWPFGRTIDEARELEALARERGVTTAVGLQGRYSPWLQQVREIVQNGRLGRILSTSFIGYDELSVGSVDKGNAYLLDIASGANPLTIHSGHYIDAMCFALGEISPVSALTATSRPKVVVRQTGETLTASAPDQIAFSGILENGAVASFHMRAGSGDPSFLWEIQGEHATLRVSSTGYLMWRPLTLSIWDANDKKWDPVPEPRMPAEWATVQTLDGPAQHVAYSFSAFAADILAGAGQTRSVSFFDALKRRETIEAVRLAALESAEKTRPSSRRMAPSFLDQ